VSWLDRDSDALILVISTDDQVRRPPFVSILSDVIRGVKNLKNLNRRDTMLSHLVLVFLIEDEVLNIWLCHRRRAPTLCSGDVVLL
jgi:hypothetical protein